MKASEDGNNGLRSPNVYYCCPGSPQKCGVVIAPMHQRTTKAVSGSDIIHGLSLSPAHITNWLSQVWPRHEFVWATIHRKSSVCASHPRPYLVVFRCMKKIVRSVCKIAS